MARREVAIPLPDGARLRALAALPAGRAPAAGWPGVVVLHEGFGRASEIAEVGERFAERGYAAVVPDLFSHGRRLACMFRLLRDSVTGRTGRATADVEATRSWLAEQEEVDDARMGVIGFSMGGGFALAYAATDPPGLRAASVNYGAVPGDRGRLAGVCPVVGSYGGRDRLFAAHGRRLAEHLAALGVPNDVRVYPAAGHSFMTAGRHPVGRLVFFPLRLGHEPSAASDAWARVFAFFDQHVRGAGDGVGRPTAYQK